MKAPLAFALVLILFLVFPFVNAQATPVVAEKSAMMNAVVDASPILPLPVRAPKDTSLRVAAATYLSSENVLIREREAYATLRARWINASSAERSALQADVSTQRQRVLLATLNRVTAIYQRMDMVIDSMNTSLIRLRSLHSSRNTPISYFDSRYTTLKTQLTALNAQSDGIAEEIEQCQRGIELSTCVQSSRDHTAELLVSLKEFFSSYRALALDVVH